jgi:hypothetical protein
MSDHKHAHEQFGLSRLREDRLIGAVPPLSSQHLADLADKCQIDDGGIPLSGFRVRSCLSSPRTRPSPFLSGFRVRSHLSFPALVPLPFCLDSECGPISLLPALIPLLLLLRLVWVILLF